MAHDVFISYSNKDKAVADAVCGTLEAADLRCWIAPRDIRPSSSWASAIMDAIVQSQVMVLVWSANASDSSTVTREVHHAFRKGIAVIPFRVEDVAFKKEFEFFLEAVHWLDALTPPLEAHLQVLAETVAALLNKDDVKRRSALKDGTRFQHPRSSFSLVRWRRQLAIGVLGLGRLRKAFTISLILLFLSFVVFLAVKYRWKVPTEPLAFRGQQQESVTEGSPDDRQVEPVKTTLFKPISIPTPKPDGPGLQAQEFDCVQSHDKSRKFFACIVADYKVLVFNKETFERWPKPVKFRVARIEFMPNEREKPIVHIVGLNGEEDMWP